MTIPRVVIILGELIDEYISIITNSKTVFTDYAMIKLVFFSSHMFSVFCQSLCDVINFILAVDKVNVFVPP